MKKLFKMGLVLVLILSVFCACDPEGPKPETEDQTKPEPTTGSYISVTVEPVEGAAKYVFDVTNKDSVVKTDLTESAIFELKDYEIDHRTPYVSVSVYDADGKFIASGWDRVSVTSGENKVALTTQPVTEKVLGKITTNISLGGEAAAMAAEGTAPALPAATIVEDCIVLSYDGNFTRTVTTVSAAINPEGFAGPGETNPEGPAEPGLPPETAPSDKPSPVIPSFGSVVTEGRYIEENGMIKLLNGEEVLDEIVASDYETMQGIPMGETAVDGCLNLGSVRIKAEDINPVISGLVQNGYEILQNTGKPGMETFKKIPASVVKMIKDGKAVNFTRDLVLDLGAIFNSRDTFIQIDLHFDGEDPAVIGLLGGKLGISAPIGIRGSVTIPLVYDREAGNIAGLPVTFTPVAGNSAAIVSFEIPAGETETMKVAIPLMKKTFGSWVLGSKYSEKKTLNLGNSDFEGLYAKLAEDETIVKYFNDITAPTFSKFKMNVAENNGLFIDGVYECADHPEFNFEFGHFDYFRFPKFEGKVFMEHNPSNQLYFVDETGKFNMIFTNVEPVKDTDGNITSLKATFTVNDRNADPETTEYKDVIFTRKDRTNTLADDLKAVINGLLAPYFDFNSDGHITYHIYDERKEKWNENSDLLYYRDDDNLKIGVTEIFLKNMLEGTPAGVPENLKMNLWAILPFDHASNKISIFKGDQGEKIGLNII